MDLNLLQQFHLVVETGSFTQAAKRLKLPISRVSRAIARLEEELKIPLIRRTTRRSQVTEAGRLLYLATKAPLGVLHKELEQIKAQSHQLSGSIRISAPQDLGFVLLAEMAAQFMDLYPLLQVELLISNEVLDLVAHNLDLAVRIGSLKDSSLKQIHLGQIEIGWYGSPGYLQLHEAPQDWADLAQHRLLLFSAFASEGQLPEVFKANPGNRLLSSDFLPLLRLALQGRGLALLPEFLARDEVKRGQLVRLLPDWDQRGAKVQILYPATKQQPARVQLFIAFLGERLKGYFKA